jgi:tetratricopeptide (TPR) repeat protein
MATGERIALLQKMLDAEPTDAFCLYSMGQEHAKQGALMEAVQWYDRTLAADADYCYAYFHKARALEQLGKVEEALTTLRSGLDHARRCGDSHAASEIASYLDTLS